MSFDWTAQMKVLEFYVLAFKFCFWLKAIHFLTIMWTIRIMEIWTRLHKPNNVPFCYAKKVPKSLNKDPADSTENALKTR